MPHTDLRPCSVDACPARETLRLIDDKWTLYVLSLLADRTLRFGELRRALPGITQKMLTQTLRKLEGDGLLQRTVYAEVPPRVEYRLTPDGQSLCAIVGALRAWGATRRRPSP